MSIYKHQFSQGEYAYSIMTEWCDVKDVLGMAVNHINIKLSMKIFLTAFYFYSFMLHSFYDCNLRAYLMSTDYEPVANTAKDIYEQVIFSPIE